MEEGLINEVKKRPILWDKNVKTKNPRVRDLIWQEVSEALSAKDCELVKKRWRSLRDAFIKNYHVVRRGSRRSAGAVGTMRSGTRWPYYESMTFIVPHIESKETAPDGGEENGPGVVATDRIGGGGSFDEDSRQAYEFESRSNGKRRRGDDVARHRRRRRGGRSKDVVDDNDDDDDDDDADDDDDEQFLLSCLPILKRFDARQNLAARTRILQTLYRVEFGDARRGAVSPNLVSLHGGRSASIFSEYSVDSAPSTSKLMTDDPLLLSE